MRCAEFLAPTRSTALPTACGRPLTAAHGPTRTLSRAAINGLGSHVHALPGRSLSGPSVQVGGLQIATHADETAGVAPSVVLARACGCPNPCAHPLTCRRGADRSPA